MRHDWNVLGGRYYYLSPTGVSCSARRGWQLLSTTTSGNLVTTLLTQTSIKILTRANNIKRCHVVSRLTQICLTWVFQSEVAYPVVSQVYRRFYQPSLTLVHFRLCGINLFPCITLNRDTAKWFKHYFQVLRMSLRIANCMSCTLEQLRLDLGVFHGLTKTPFCVNCRYADILV